MFPEFTLFPQEQIKSQLEFGEEDLQLSLDQNKFRIRSLSRLHFDDDLLFVCECADMFYNHHLCEGKCNSCSCEKFVCPSICVELEFSISDLFEIDFPVHSERDSSQWWIEFAEWFTKNKNYI